MRGFLVWLIKQRFVIPAAAGFLSACALALLANPNGGVRYLFVVTCGGAGVSLLVLLIDVGKGWSRRLLEREARQMALEADSLWNAGRRQYATRLGMESQHLWLSTHSRLADRPFEWMEQHRIRRHDALKHGWSRIELSAASWQHAALIADRLVDAFEEVRMPFWSGFETETTQWHRLLSDRGNSRVQSALQCPTPPTIPQRQ